MTSQVSSSYLARISVLIGALLLWSALLAPLSALASDTEYHYSWTKGDSGPNVPDVFGIGDNAGVFEETSFSYDTSSQQLQVEFTISDPGSPNLLASLFTLVLTPGWLPLEQCGNEVAVLYFDASGATPVVTAYTYVPDPGDLDWETGSWHTGDQICSSLNSDCGNWVNEISAVDNADGSRTFRLDVLTDVINAFTPSSQNPASECTPYSGAQFDEGIGFWLETFSYPNLLSEYGSDGFLSELDHGCWFYGTQEVCTSGSNVYQGQFDAKHLVTYQKPFCEDASGMITLDPDEPFTGIVTGKSPDGDPLTITYTGLPNGATVDPANGVEDPDGMIDANLSWTPTDDDAGSTSVITFTFTEKDGTAVCELTIDVTEDVCDGVVDQCDVCNGDGTTCLGCEETSILQTQFSMDGNALLQFQNIKKLNRRLVKFAKGTDQESAAKKFKRNTNKAAKSLYSTAWNSTWSFDSLIQQCTNAEFCVSISNVSTLATYIESVDDLFGLAKKANKRIKKVGGKAGKLFKAAKAARGESLLSASQIPSAQSLCTMSDTES